VHRKARCDRAERAQDAREDRADRQWHGVCRSTEEQNRAERLATPSLWHADAVGGSTPSGPDPLTYWIRHLVGEALTGARGGICGDDV
jgi:hypothetical protein